ncbi:TlpA family protein disulfide reductase [Phocaeicola paurosaccharolyticus]|uniref:TlpA family protein disulfide reductase n=1 Tax=Phocaeicola paurosaccharolyticus TaxID=732242 RepID=UPI000555D04A|nr:thioredoxin-like domain-containing protein [Phocaeicola paurosaccharolyticus]
MKSVKSIFLFLLISSVISLSFIDKNKSNVGLKIGDNAPQFSLVNESKSIDLKKLNGNFVLISFWASYDAESRVKNAILNNAASKMNNLQIVSVSFDEYRSIFDETINNDQLDKADCFIELKGNSSNLFKSYELNKGFTNYLLDKNGNIVAKNIDSKQLFSLIN